MPAFTIPITAGKSHNIHIIKEIVLNLMPSKQFQVIMRGKRLDHAVGALH
jgi:hypothetical protein